MTASLVDQLPRNETLKRGVHSLGIADRLERYQNVFSLVPGETVNRLFRDGSGHVSGLVDYWQSLLPQMEKLDELGGFSLLEIRSSLPDELLMYADKLSMAHSLEARVPYLDRTVVEYAQRLDASFKVRRGERKWLHRRVCEKFLAAANFETQETRLRRERGGRLVQPFGDGQNFRAVAGWQFADVFAC